MSTDSNFAVALKGEIIKSLAGAIEGNDRIEIETESGRSFLMYHSQDCCESVDIFRVEGNLTDILGEPLTDATEVIEREVWPTELEQPGYLDSWTVTRFSLATAKGRLTIWWLGHSNGYCGEDVSFVEMAQEVAA